MSDIALSTDIAAKWANPGSQAPLSELSTFFVSQNGVGMATNLDALAAAIGSQGPQGSQGSQGPGGEGPQGSQGPQGTQGDQGSPGQDSTVPGPQGDQGVQGSASTVPGPQGSQGQSGAQGPQGTHGADSTVPGPQGAPGSQGSQGATGIGQQGAQGAVGQTGAQGAQGAQGVHGADSTVPGPQGTQGSQGSQGPQGAGGGGSALVLSHSFQTFPNPASSNSTSWTTLFTIPFTPTKSGSKIRILFCTIACQDNNGNPNFAAIFAPDGTTQLSPPTSASPAISSNAIVNNAAPYNGSSLVMLAEFTSTGTSAINFYIKAIAYNSAYSLFMGRTSTGGVNYAAVAASTVEILEFA